MVKITTRTTKITSVSSYNDNIGDIKNLPWSASLFMYLDVLLYTKTILKNSVTSNTARKSTDLLGNIKLKVI